MSVGSVVVFFPPSISVFLRADTYLTLLCFIETKAFWGYPLDY
jgi:hypothetical protein